MITTIAVNTAAVFIIGVSVGLVSAIVLRGVLSGLHAFLIDRSDGRLVSIDELKHKLDNGWRIVIVSHNLIFNGIALRPGEQKLADCKADGLLIRRIRVSKSFLEGRFPAADIRVIHPVHFE